MDALSSAGNHSEVPGACRDRQHHQRSALRKPPVSAQRIPSRPFSPDQADPTERLFIALPVPAPVREALAALARALPGVKWTRPEKLHLTLRFLGDVPVEKIEPMIVRLAMVRVARFVLPVEGVGTFPPNRPPRVVWAGTGSGHPRLFQLRQRLDDTLLAAGLQLDVRTFHPHATLARCTDDAGAALTHWLHQHREFVAPPFLVDAFELFSSDLRPDGAVYTLKRRFPLVN
jgi:2'-5' RNA ligase